MKRLFAIAAAVWLALPLSALAHTTLLSASPKDGSELAQSPPTIEIQFRDAVQLTSVMAVGVDKKERRLEFSASAKPNSFVVRDPHLAAGRNEIKWKALSKDGHVISGTLVFVVKPPANIS